MKRLLLVLSTALLLTGINSCEKTDDTNTGHQDHAALCNDGILNGGETELDCGGACTACPPPATMSCTLGNTSFVAKTCYGQNFNPSIRIYGNDNRPLNFMFVPTALNTELPIHAVSFAYNGEVYAMEPGDSGTVVVTYLDTVRKIASGTFRFSGNRVTGPNSATVTEGKFDNVRYNH